ncbi:hypothetical protein CO038_04850 [Candidatus Pacearchaeota archaeon CG_4_9_14_0_2_um_filter_39_13]|nr:hypothetical protein [Candidatus Pacearchaeota archaeon]OIO43687.1 MAG: hypothetical protein AUJ64_01870 [Candidatus Pacearchaeota archaeon CG1_02_39_14]PJC44224.1 MAG: hypothetical protein CO038_04850 [Candidatus Pacearchaeota archaeon CG_4_9_14_0_2_um_filter_39_13]
MIGELRNNVQTEANLVRELIDFIDKLERADDAEVKIIVDIIDSLKNRIKLINESIPSLLTGMSVGESFRNVKVPVEKISHKDETRVSINRNDIEKYLEELSISKELIRRLKKGGIKEKTRTEFKRGGGFYSKLSNKFFLNFSQRSITSGGFKSIISDLKKSNLDILSSSYISMMFFSTFISVFFGILLAIFFIFVNVSSIPPFITLYQGDMLLRILKVSWIIPAVPIFTFAMFYFYPGVEKRSVGKKIDQELPFVVIQMGSISGSGIEPVEIFKIIGLSGDYKYAGREIVKLLNQLNIYGYDLVTALTNVSRSTPSPRLSELLVGLATTINSGGDLDSFFSKRAESLLLEYTLEREKFTKVAETFMDIYISVVIATPMILLLLLVLISVSGVGLGIGITEMSLLIILLVGIVNILFLVFLHMKQPRY